MKRGAVPTLVAAVSLFVHAMGAAGQRVEDLAAACTSAGGDAELCSATALAGRDLLGHVGVLAGPGSEVPGVGSTLGTRLGGMPRVALAVRGTVASVGVPDLAAGARSRASFLVPGVQVTGGVGVWDGFRLLPTVGGLLSFDLIGHASFMFFPQGEGFDGRLDALAFGARLGILRESFTLPGASVSVMRRNAGSLQLGSVGGGGPAEVTVDPSVTSVRVTVAKDLFALGVLAGVGWDDHSSGVEARAQSGAGAPVSFNGSLDVDRRLYFIGVSKQIGIFSWVSAEIGFAEAFAPASSLAPGVPQPEDRLAYGTLSVLLKL